MKNVTPVLTGTMCDECGEEAAIRIAGERLPNTAYLCGPCGQELIRRMSDQLRQAAALRSLPDRQPVARYRTDYRCPACGNEWDEVWPSPCDSDCPQCGLKNIEAFGYIEI